MLHQCCQMIKRCGILLLLTGFLSGLQIASAETATERLIENSSGQVLMIRHALAPGTGDPASFQLRDCSTQRNLDERGRAQSVAIGQWLRDKGLTDVAVYSSQWCRCLETAELMGLAPVQELPALNSFYQRPQDRAPNMTALNQFLAELPRSGRLVVMVTHFVTISEISGRGTSSGEGMLLALEPDGQYSVVGSVSFD